MSDHTSFTSNNKQTNKMKKTTYQIPDGCTGVTIEQQDDKIIVVFEKPKEEDPRPWRAEYDETYWCYDVWKNRVFPSTEDDDIHDMERHESGNYFRTEAEAQAALKHRLKFKFEK